MLEKTEFLLLEKKEGKCYHKIIFKDKGDFFFSWTLSTLPMRTLECIQNISLTEWGTLGPLKLCPCLILGAAVSMLEKCSWVFGTQTGSQHTRLQVY